MKTRLLLSELLHRSGLRANDLATILNNKEVTQSTISRFKTGKTRQPKVSSVTPIAEYFGINVEAFYREDLAEKLLDQIRTGELIVNKRGVKQKARVKQSDSGEHPSHWPFLSITEQQWMELDDFQRGRIEGFVQSVVEQPHADSGTSEAPKNIPHSSIAQQVLTKKLTTESSDIYKQGTHQHADGFE